MSDFKEFEAKTLDAAIQNACDYFNTDRGKLEINILEDAKTGIFGIIGSRNAKIEAKKTSFTEMTKVFTKKEEKTKETKVKEEVKSENKTVAKVDKKEVAKVEKKEIAKVEEAKPPKLVEKNEVAKIEKAKVPAVKEEKIQALAPKEEVVAKKYDEESALKRTPLADLDQELLINTGNEVIHALLNLIIEGDEINIEVQNDRLCMAIETENSGLLIGKEGQTLAAIEYLTTRIISKKLGTSVRVQIEVGDYRSRQDQRLHEFALTLAERVIESGKSASTRPLSAYQRRIVHLALQEMPDVQTRSIGDGSMKRVVLSRVKNTKRA